MSVTRIENYIGGEFLPPAEDTWLDGFNPATGQIHTRVADSGPRDIAAAVSAAGRAWPAWSGSSAEHRALLLGKLADLIDSNLHRLAAAESEDNGKPLKMAEQVDIPRASSNFRFFGSLIRGFASESHAAPEYLNYTLRKPIGIVGCISPWNLPLYLFTWKIAPALAVGNCVIGKPSEITPLTAHLLAELVTEAGFPPGVLNIVHGRGSGAGAALVDHPDVLAVSFTGGTVTGARIAAAAAPRFKKLSLELGGKNPNIIFADCDYEQALSTTVRSSFSNQGQICLCGSRVFVERPLYDRFREDLVQAAGRLKVGDPREPDTDLGAIVSAAHHQKIHDCVQRARDEGGRVLCGGAAVVPSGRCAQGWFYAPTVIEGLANECRTNQEEIFGPVVTLMPFTSEADVVRQANDVPYGLSATIWTRDLGRAHRVADQVQAGVIWVNCWLIRDLRTPFGGMKQSGVGREGGLEALRFFTETKNICIKFS